MGRMGWMDPTHPKPPLRPIPNMPPPERSDWPALLEEGQSVRSGGGILFSYFLKLLSMFIWSILRSLTNECPKPNERSEEGAPKEGQIRPKKQRVEV